MRHPKARQKLTPHSFHNFQSVSRCICITNAEIVSNNFMRINSDLLIQEYPWKGDSEDSLIPHLLTPGSEEWGF